MNLNTVVWRDYLNLPQRSAIGREWLETVFSPKDGRCQILVKDYPDVAHEHSLSEANSQARSPPELSLILQ